MNEFLRKFLDWITMLLRWLYAAPGAVVQWLHDTVADNSVGMDASHESGGGIASGLVKGRRLFAECVTSVRQRLKYAAVGLLLFGAAGTASAQNQRNLGFSNGLEGWRLYYGAVLYYNQTSVSASQCDRVGNQNYAADFDYCWDYQEYLDQYILRYGSLTKDNCPATWKNVTGHEFKEYFSSIEESGDGYATTSNNFYEINAEDELKQIFINHGVKHASQPEDQYRFNVIAQTSPSAGQGIYSDLNVNHYDKNLTGTIHSENITLPRVMPGKDFSCRIGAAGARHSDFTERIGGTNVTFNSNPLSAEFASKSFNGDMGHTAAAEMMLYEFAKDDDDDILMIHFLLLFITVKIKD